MIHVYHAQNTSDSLFYMRNGKIYNQFNAIKEFFDDRYDLVGMFDTPSTLMDDQWNLEKIYEKTQNLSGPWNNVAPCRSTSVGDIMVFGSDFYIVASCGFEKLI